MGGGGVTRWSGTKLLVQFFATAQKSKFPKRIFFDIVATHNDHPSYVKHVLGSIYVLVSLFGYWVWGGGGGSPNGLVHKSPRRGC